MSEFLNASKRKAAAAPVEPEHRFTRAGLFLLLLAGLASFVFVAPTTVGRAVDWVARLFGRSDKSSFSALLAAINAEKNAKNGPARGAFLSPAAGSSLAMVAGNPAAWPAADLAAKLPRAAGIRGILSAEDARRGLGGVAIRPDEMNGERARLAQGASLGDSPAYAGKYFFAGTATPEASPRLKAALESAALPDSIAGVGSGKIPGRIPRARAVALKASALGHLALNRAEGGNGAMMQLADGHHSAVAAREARTAEFAAASLGGVYDGRGLGRAPIKDSSSAPLFDGASIPRIPSLQDRSGDKRVIFIRRAQ